MNSLLFQSLSRSVEELTELYFYLVNIINEKQTNAPWSRSLRPCLYQASNSATSSAEWSAPGKWVFRIRWERDPQTASQSSVKTTSHCWHKVVKRLYKPAWQICRNEPSWTFGRLGGTCRSSSSAPHSWEREAHSRGGQALPPGPVLTLLPPLN